MPASYNIAPVLQDPDVDPGDDIQIDIYISGAGQTGRKRLHILHPYTDVFEEENVGELIMGTELVPEGVSDEDTEIIEENSDTEYVAKPRNNVPKEYRTSNTQDHVGSTIDLGDWIFHPVPDNMVRRTSGGSGKVTNSFNMKLSEGKFGEKPPLQLTLNISEDADPGDYEIMFLLTYESDLGIKTSRQNIEFHINDWVEKKQPTLTRIVIATALIGLLVQTVDSILPWIISTFL